MAPPPARATSAHATSQTLSVDEGEAGTTSSRPAVSSAGLVQIPIQRTNMPNRSEHIATYHFHAHTYIAGNIRNYLAQWKALTQDQWIHQVVEGYQIQFSSAPPVDNACPMYEMDKPRLEALDQEILDLLNKGAVEKVESGELGFASPMFVVPKKGGKWRPIINLKFLNQFVEKLHFKMEDIKKFERYPSRRRPDGQTGPEGCVFFHINRRKTSKIPAVLYWRNQLLQFTCLPFGLSSTPYVFTKLLRPILTFLRDKGIRCLMYLDDMLILGRTATELNHNFALVKPLLTSLGFLVNEDKSVPGPTQELEFLGFFNQFQENDTCSNRRENKISDLTVQTAMESPQITIRQLARIIGVMTSMTPAVLPTPLHYRALQELKNTALDHHHSYFAQITLTQEAKQDLMWWRTYLRQWKSRSILLKRESDASDLGWEQYVSIRKHQQEVYGIHTRRPSTSTARSFLQPGWGSNVCFKPYRMYTYIFG